MKKISAHFFALIILLSFFLSGFTQAHAAGVRVELEPNTTIKGGKINAVAFDCPSGKVDFFWQTADQKAKGSTSFQSKKGFTVNPASEDANIKVAVYQDWDTSGLDVGDWYVHARCNDTKENSPDVKLTIKEAAEAKAVANEAAKFPDPPTVDGYKQFTIDYTGFEQGQCYYLTVLALSGSAGFTSLAGKGVNLPNYDYCINDLLNAHPNYYSSSQLSGSGKLTVDALPPGDYKIRVNKFTNNFETAIDNTGNYYTKDVIATGQVTVKASAAIPHATIKDHILKSGSTTRLYAGGCPPNSKGFIKWSKKDGQLNDRDGNRAVSFDAQGSLISSTTDTTGAYLEQQFTLATDQPEADQLWVECGAVKSDYDFFTVTNQDPSNLPQVFMQLPDKSIKKQGDTIAFPSGTSVTIWATQCPHNPDNSNKANFEWKHAKQSNGIMEQWGSRNDVGVTMSTGETDHFSVKFEDDNYNQIQAFCSGVGSAPLYFKVGDPDGITKDKNSTGDVTPTAIPTPIYAPCVEGINAAGTTVNVLEGNPSAEVIQSRLKDIVKCTKVGSAIGDISTDPQGFILKLFQVILSLSGGFALLIIIRAGYKYMTSQGNAETVKTAQEEITSAIVGLLFLVFSIVILQIIGVDILHLPGLS